MGYRAAEEYTIINYISYSCCSQRHVALEHTKPLFNKHDLLTLHNLYTFRSSLELIKILKLHSPYPVYENLQVCPRTHHFRLLGPTTLIFLKINISLVLLTSGINVSANYLITQIYLAHHTDPI